MATYVGTLGADTPAAGFDVYYLLDGNDNLDFVTATSVTIYGGNGDDHIAPDTGNDLVFGDEGNDTIAGWGGSDSLHGGSGNDVIWGDTEGSNVGSGDDWIFGDDGNDTIYTGATSGVAGFNVVYGGNGDDIVNGGSGTDYVYGENGNDTIITGGATDYLLGGLGNDYLSAGDGDDSVWGEWDNDTLVGGNGNDSLVAGPGNDSVFGGLGNDTIYTGDGLANLTLYSGEYVRADDGNDTIYATGEYEGSAIVEAGAGNDILFASENKQVDFWGDDGNDTLTGGSFDDWLFGGNGNDTITANGGNDRVVGGAGDDYLSDGDGTDYVYGGTGADSFDFSSSIELGVVDTIKDFEDGIDKILLPVQLQGIVHISASSFGTFVSIPIGSDSYGILIEGVSPSSITLAGDFVFIT